MKLINIFLLALTSFVFAGCASTEKMTKGSYLTESNATILADSNIEDDVVIQLVKDFPPAKTKLNFTHSTLDGFGIALIKQLRDKGYAVAEFNPENNNVDGLDFSYIVDNILPNQLFLSVHIENASISRLYKIEQNQLQAVGYWTHKE